MNDTPDPPTRHPKAGFSTESRRHSVQEGESIAALLDVVLPPELSIDNDDGAVSVFHHLQGGRRSWSKMDATVAVHLRVSGGLADVPRGGLSNTTFQSGATPQLEGLTIPEAIDYILEEVAKWDLDRLGGAS